MSKNMGADTWVRTIVTRNGSNVRLENIDINETYIINEFNELDFNQLEAFLKLYQY